MERVEPFKGVDTLEDTNRYVSEKPMEQALEKNSSVSFELKNDPFTRFWA